MAVREDVGVFDVSHMGEIETSGPDALALLQRLLSNDIAAIPIGGAQYSVLCREDGGVLDDLFTYRLEPDRYLTVTNAANHERDLAWFQQPAEDFDDVQVTDRLDDYAMLAVQGPRARELVQAISDAPLPARMTAATRHLRGADVLVCGTGYTGEDGVELLASPRDAPMLWDELLRRGAIPAGLAARDTLRLEACFHLYGNDLSTEARPDRSGARLVLPRGDGVHRRRGRAAVREAGPAEKLVAFAIEGPGIARQGNRSSAAVRLRAARSRRALGSESAWPMSPPRERRGRRRAWKLTFVARSARLSVKEKPLYRKGVLMAEANYPADLLYHPEHDWARVEDDRRHARHHLVRAGRARRGRVLRSAGDRRRRSPRTSPTPRSSR